jgi:DNA-binding NarL/FixJ family response regulator
MPPIRVLIVDRQALFRESLGAVLAAQDTFTVVGDAGDAAAATRLAGDLSPDVIITDLCLPDMHDGGAVVTRLLAAQPNARIVVLAARAEEATVAAVVAAGAQGYVLKSQPAAELMAAIRTVAGGGAALDPRAVSVIWGRFQQLIQQNTSTARRFEEYSRFESDVLDLLADGRTTRQMADTLLSTPAAVEKALADICEKLHARNRTQAVAIAQRQGLIAKH